MKASLFYFLSAFLLLLLSLVAVIGPHTELIDVTEYHCYASIFWTGHLQINKTEQRYCLSEIKSNQIHKYKLPQEYPLLSLFIFSLPLLSPFSYSLGFRLLMLVFLLTIWMYFFKVKKFTSGIIFLLLITLGLSSVTFNRYDLSATTLTFFAIILAYNKKFLPSYLLLALATFLKIYPLFLIPLVFLFELQTHKHKLLNLKNYYFVSLGVIALALLLILSLKLDFVQTLAPLQYQAARPLQIESIPASIFLLTSFGKVCFIQSFGSLNILHSINHQCSPNLVSQTLETIFSILMLLSLIVVYLNFFKGRIKFTGAVVLLILSLLIFNKVLSPQYFIWLAPFLALKYKKISLNTLIWFILFALTYLIYPIMYSQTSMSNLLGVISVRNILLVFLYIYTWKEVLHKFKKQSVK